MNHYRNTAVYVYYGFEAFSKFSMTVYFSYLCMKTTHVYLSLITFFLCGTTKRIP